MNAYSNTTLDPPNGLLLRVLRDGDGILVKDTVGLRYGWGLTLGDAVRMWADCVMDVCDEENAGGSLLAEQRAYRQALAAPDTTQEPPRYEGGSLKRDAPWRNT